MIRKSEKRHKLKERVRRWVGHSEHLDTHKSIVDAAILETFFHIYNELETGASIHDIGIELGVMPLP